MLLVVTFATFCLMYRNGSGIAQATLGLGATPEAVQAQMARLGLDRPLLVQYGDWLSSAVTGDLGRSFYTSESVAAALANRVPVTLAIVILTLLLTAVLSVLLGVVAAIRGGTTDRVVQVVSVVGAAIPLFIVAIALVFTFAINWRALPATGYVSPDQSLSGWLASLTLPVIALLIGAVAGAAAQFRTAVLDTRRQGLRPHPPGPGHPGAGRHLPARAAQLGRSRPDRAEPDRDRPDGRRGVHRAGVRAARPGPVERLVRATSATCRW